MSLDKRQKAYIVIHSSSFTTSVSVSTDLRVITAVMGNLLSREVFHQESCESRWEGAGAGAAFYFSLGVNAIDMLILSPVSDYCVSYISPWARVRTVEAIGWGLFSILEEGRRPEDLSLKEFRSYFQRGEQLAKESKKEFDWLDRLPSDTKDKYEELSVQLANINLSTEQKAVIVKHIEELLDPYRPR